MLNSRRDRVIFCLCLLLVLGAVMMRTSRQRASKRFSELVAAAQLGEVDKIKLLLKQEIEPKVTDAQAKPTGSLALIEAARYGQLEALKVLLEAGSDPNADHCGALALALKEQNRDCAMFLLDHGSKQDLLDHSLNFGKDTALMMAVSTKLPPSQYFPFGPPPSTTQLALVQKLIGQGANVNARNARNQTALTRAAEEGHTEIVEELIAQHADMNWRTDVSETALSNAVRYGHIETIKALLSYGASVSINAETLRESLAIAPPDRRPSIAATLKAAGFKP